MCDRTLFTLLEHMLKITQSRSKWSRVFKNHDRTLFTLLAGRRKCAIVHCSRFWDHMFKIAQNRQKSGPGSSTNYDRTLFTRLACRRKSTIVHCSRFWPVVENVRSYIVHAAGTTCLKMVKTPTKTGLGVLENSRSKIVHASGWSSKIHERALFTLLGPHVWNRSKPLKKLVLGLQKITIENCSRF